MMQRSHLRPGMLVADRLSDMAGLIEPHIPALRRFAWSLLRDQAAADDLVQDCLERLVARWSQRRRDGSIKAWSMTVLYNLFLNQRRASRRRGHDVQLEEWDGAPPEHGTSEAEQRLVVRDVLAGLAELPEDQRALLLLVAVEDFSYEEAAKVMGLTVGMAVSRLRQARERLRERVEGRPQLRRVV